MRNLQLLTTVTVCEPTEARYLHLQGVQFHDQHQNPKEGEDTGTDGVIMRYRNGYIHAENQPAIECTDGHQEYWEYGFLHRDIHLPAVITNNSKVFEYWKNGQRRS